MWNGQRFDLCVYTSSVEEKRKSLFKTREKKSPFFLSFVCIYRENRRYSTEGPDFDENYY